MNTKNINVMQFQESGGDANKPPREVAEDGVIERINYRPHPDFPCGTMLMWDERTIPQHIYKDMLSAKAENTQNTTVALFVHLAEDQALPDELIESQCHVFPLFEPNTPANANAIRRCRDSGRLYRALHSIGAEHAADRPLAEQATLWSRLVETAGGEIPEWFMPSPGAWTTWMYGDKATHNGVTWKSVHDNNVWEPGVFGWIEVN